jgi:hypothetical protein
MLVPSGTSHSAGTCCCVFVSVTFGVAGGTGVLICYNLPVGVAVILIVGQCIPSGVAWITSSSPVSVEHFLKVCESRHGIR